MRGEEANAAVDISVIKEFMYLSKDLNFSKTAARCHVSQSVFSRHISALEAELGYQLLTRNSKKVQLTEYGEIFAEKAKQIVVAYDSAIEDMRNLTEGFSQTLSIGYTTSLSQSFLDEAYARQLEEHPHIRVELLPSWEERVTTMLNQGRSDIALALFFVEPDPDVYNSVVLFDDYYVLVVPEGHPLYDEDSIKLKNLKDETLMIPEVSDTPLQNERLTKVLGHFASVEVKGTLCNKLDGVALTNAGHGLAMMPNHQIGGISLRGCRAIPVDEKDLHFEVRAVWRKENDVKKIRDFVQILLDLTHGMDISTLRNMD